MRAVARLGGGLVPNAALHNVSPNRLFGTTMQLAVDVDVPRYCNPMTAMCPNKLG